MRERDPSARLREELEEARRKGKWKAAARAAERLAELEPREPRWPHQLGEALRRANDAAGAVKAFERATDLYARAGFVARAVAMAKTLLALDPRRTDVLARVDPSAAKAHHREARPEAFSVPAPKSVEAVAPPLEPAADAADDEVRFFEVAEPSVIELDLAELELVEEAPASDPAIDRLALMPSFPLFSELPRERLQRLAEGADLVELPAGARIIAAGEPADALYCIVSGAVRVEIPGVDRRPVMGEGDVFGESCLLDAGTRQAHVFVGDDAPLVALRIEREVLDLVAEGLPELDVVLFELLARRVLGNFLRTSPLFTAFSPEDRRELARRFEVRRAAKGVDLLVEGKRSDGLYALVQGKLSMNGVEHGPGTIVGVAALFARAPAAATVTTLAECVLLRLPAKRLAELVAAYPPALAHLAEIAAREPAVGGGGLS